MGPGGAVGGEVHPGWGPASIERDDLRAGKAAQNDDRRMSLGTRPEPNVVFLSKINLADLSR